MSGENTLPRVILIEDSLALGKVYQEYLSTLPIQIEQFTEGKSGLNAVLELRPEVVLLDLNLPGISGQEILSRLNEAEFQPAVVVVTAHGSVGSAVEAMRDGAFDFLQKPFDAERLRVTVKNALEKQSLTSLVQSYKESLERDHFHGFMGSSIPIQAVYRIIESAAASRASVFITGESGSGKEVCANAIHQEGDRRDMPFIPINCAAIPKDLMESEIFGHVKGSFTGAAGDRKGAASLADGGTLFLDEIGEMDLSLQSKLLRFVQTGTFQKVGGNELEHVDVRFICATNKDPLEMIKAGTFREDLYYRLHVIPIHLPALRECREDILQIANHFLSEYADEESKEFRDFSPEAQQVLLTYQWPGNVRQLQNVIRNVVVLNEGGTAQVDMLPKLMLHGASNLEGSVENTASVMHDLGSHHGSNAPVLPLWLSEKKAIEAAIEQCGGNIPRAASLLEVSPSTIYRKKQSWEENDT
jgi:DNA-binding NtrC family response regulator